MDMGMGRNMRTMGGGRKYLIETPTLEIYYPQRY
jgi:hypothetical protein